MIKQIKNIHNIVIDGPNGVGKSSLIDRIFKKYNYRYMCYHRGDVSNFIYAKKYDRPFFSTQRNLPFLHIVLLAKPSVLASRIKARADKENWSHEELEKELKTISEFDLFLDACEQLKDDYFIVRIMTDHLTEDEVAEQVFGILDSINHHQPVDDPATFSSWNKQYDAACSRLGMRFKVVDNQPYIDDIPMMVESTLHDGAYETFSNKKFFDNLIYAYGYFVRDVRQIQTFDFNYIINSKINRRHEVFQYYDAFESNGKSCIASDYPLIKMQGYSMLNHFPRCHGRAYLDLIAKSKATVYCARDLEYLKLQTARLYEAIIANNIVFVDRDSDKDCEILRNIHGDDKEVIKLLYVTPQLICSCYDKIIDDEDLRQRILQSQHEWLDKMFDDLEQEHKL